MSIYFSSSLSFLLLGLFYIWRRKDRSIFFSISGKRPSSPPSVWCRDTISASGSRSSAEKGRWSSFSPEQSLTLCKVSGMIANLTAAFPRWRPECWACFELSMKGVFKKQQHLKKQNQHSTYGQLHPSTSFPSLFSDSFPSLLLVLQCWAMGSHRSLGTAKPIFLMQCIKRLASLNSTLSFLVGSWARI